MATAAFTKLRQRPLWQVGLALLALYLMAFAAILVAIQLLAVIGPLLSIAGASLAVAWAFLGIARPRHEHEWQGDEWVGS
jgi:hypothetical protein